MIADASGRITSYNVCYTKLLRILADDLGRADLGEGPLRAERADGRCGTGGGAGMAGGIAKSSRRRDHRAEHRNNFV